MPPPIRRVLRDTPYGVLPFWAPPVEAPGRSYFDPGAAPTEVLDSWSSTVSVVHSGWGPIGFSTGVTSADAFLNTQPLEIWSTVVNVGHAFRVRGGFLATRRYRR